MITVCYIKFSGTPAVDYTGRSKQKCDWQHLTISILLVWNNFIKNLFTTKSKEFKSVFLNGQASRPYNKTGKRYNQMYHHLLRGNSALLCQK